MAQYQLTTPCIKHEGALTDKGYGASWFEGKWCSAHRKAYCQHHMTSTASLGDLVVRHKCDNRACINPDHLELGTHADNAQDMVDRSRQGTPPVLTMEQAREIRRDYIPGGNRWHPSPAGQPQLARKYGVPQSVISQILRNITYKE